MQKIVIKRFFAAVPWHFQPALENSVLLNLGIFIIKNTSEKISRTACRNICLTKV